MDLLHARAAELDRDGVVAIRGINRVSALAQVLALRRDLSNMAVVLVADPVAELVPHARLVLADFGRSLRFAFPGIGRSRSADRRR